MNNGTNFGSLIKALEGTDGSCCGFGNNWVEVFFPSGDFFTVFAVGGFARAWRGSWKDRVLQHLETCYQSFGLPMRTGITSDDMATCMWLVHRMLGQDIPVPEHLRKPVPRHEAVCRFLRSIDSLPTKNIGGLSFVGTAASMAADALEGRPDDWVNETTREQRVAILYGVFAMVGDAAKNEDVVEAIRALEALEPGLVCLTCSQSSEDK